MTDEKSHGNPFGPGPVEGDDTAGPFSASNKRFTSTELGDAGERGFLDIAALEAENRIKEEFKPVLKAIEGVKNSVRILFFVVGLIGVLCLISLVVAISPQAAESSDQVEDPALVERIDAFLVSLDGSSSVYFCPLESDAPAGMVVTRQGCTGQLSVRPTCTNMIRRPPVGFSPAAPEREDVRQCEILGKLVRP